jgi:hypothetical protein
MVSLINTVAYLPPFVPIILLSYFLFGVWRSGRVWTLNTVVRQDREFESRTFRQ